MLTRLISFINNNNKLCDGQHGFRPKHSSCTAVIDVVNHITLSINSKLLTLILLIDISKAFDSINHEILLSKLQYYGIRGPTFLWFQSYLSSRFQYTLINNIKSDLKHNTTSVPQGSILGPRLYLLYVNDILFIRNGTKYVLYADDTILLVTGKCLKDLLDVTKDSFTIFSRRFSATFLALNAKKTNIISFSN